MSKHDTSPEFERKLQELAARTAHMVVPRSDAQHSIAEARAFLELPRMPLRKEAAK